MNGLLSGLVCRERAMLRVMADDTRMVFLVEMNPTGMVKIGLVFLTSYTNDLQDGKCLPQISKKPSCVLIVSFQITKKPFCVVFHKRFVPGRALRHPSAWLICFCSWLIPLAMAGIFIVRNVQPSVRSSKIA